MSKDQLIAKIKLSNNGYLFAVAYDQLKTAGAFEDSTFVITGNRVTAEGFTVRLR